jgi:hypothetical protein
MSTEVEFFRVTPTEGEHYYAILASRRHWDKNKLDSLGHKGDDRYFASPSQKRYMGQYVGCGRAGSGDGREYWEIYVKDGKRYELHYDCEGMTCLEKVDPEAAKDSATPVSVDANIRLAK